jgi:hypothetical protein
MIRALKVFFSHPLIWIYIILNTALIAICMRLNLYEKYYFLVSILVIAPFYEWVMHKYVLHGINQNESEFYVRLMNRLHRDHHRFPKKIETAFAPLWAGLIVPLQFFILGTLLTFNWQGGLFLAMATLTYYIYYEWMHMAHHIDEYKPLTPWGRALRNAHMWHHYKNENYWWGVTSSIGDKVLKTYVAPQDVPKSRFEEKIGRV